MTFLYSLNSQQSQHKRKRPEKRCLKVEDGTESFHYTLNVNYVEHKSHERVRRAQKIVKYYIYVYYDDGFFPPPTTAKRTLLTSATVK